jgi:IMP dehydrogenase
MEDIFKKMQVGYTYQQLLVRPRISDVNSRQDVDLSSEIVPGVVLKIPIIASPMLTISESKMCIKMYEIGGMGILHRFADLDYLENEIKTIANSIPKSHVAFAIGVKEEDKEHVARLAPYASVICIDVNIGEHIKTINMTRHLRENYPNHKIIAGNVSTYEGAKALCEAGADCIRATNGGGSACTTLATTGVGVPTATSLYECIQAADQYGKTVLSCGGHKTSGTMVVALALGACGVIVGGLLAGTSACPEHAFFLDPDTREYKARYMGMASRKAQEQRSGSLKTGTAPEGISKVIPIGPKTRVLITELAGGLRSGLSLAGCHSIKELQTTAEFTIRT